MLLSSSVLGGHIAQTLRDRTNAPLLTIGADTFSRHDLAAIDCFNFTAAANLSAILNRELHAHTASAGRRDE